MVWRQFVATLLLVSPHFAVDAAVVSYLVEGDLIRSGGSATSSDVHHSDGFAFGWRFDIKADNCLCRNISANGIVTTFNAISEVLTFQRQCGFSDLMTSMPIGQLGEGATMRGVIVNSPSDFERITFRGNTAVDINLEVNGLALNLPAGFLNGDADFPRNLSLADAISFDFGNTWNIFNVASNSDISMSRALGVAIT
ncbi:MAG: hypothetical protein D6698_02220 [Gammaproteobacteria bacterium]|nr:MAG: hypothetical protein D6698_02220 [Gammaproteobacteria bacterium]